MFTDPTARTSLVPLIMRLTLAAIFLFHGLGKITVKKNDWGSAWATNLIQKEAQPNPRAMRAIDREIQRVHDQRVKLENEAEALPEDEKAASEERQEELAKREDELRKTVDTMKVAYNESTDLPEALSWTGIQLAVAWGELFCGLLLLVGWLTRFATVAIVIIMAGAIYTITGPRGFDSMAGAGLEYNLAIVAMAVVLFITGPGLYSIENWLSERRRAAQHLAMQQPHAPVTAPTPTGTPSEAIRKAT